MEAIFECPRWLACFYDLEGDPPCMVCAVGQTACGFAFDIGVAIPSKQG